MSLAAVEKDLVAELFQGADGPVGARFGCGSDGLPGVLSPMGACLSPLSTVTTAQSEAPSSTYSNPNGLRLPGSPWHPLPRLEVRVKVSEELLEKPASPPKRRRQDCPRPTSADVVEWGCNAEKLAHGEETCGARRKKPRGAEWSGFSQVVPLPRREPPPEYVTLRSASLGFHLGAPLRGGWAGSCRRAAPQGVAKEATSAGTAGLSGWVRHPRGRSEGL